jgi:hypothetical protein
MKWMMQDGGGPEKGLAFRIVDRPDRGCVSLHFPVTRLKNLLFCTPGGSPWGIAESSLIPSQPVTHLCQIPASSIASAAANAGQPSPRFGMMRGFARHGVGSAIAGGAVVLQQQRTQRSHSFATLNKK